MFCVTVNNDERPIDVLGGGGGGVLGKALVARLTRPQVARQQAVDIRTSCHGNVAYCWTPPHRLPPARAGRDPAHYTHIPGEASLGNDPCSHTCHVQYVNGTWVAVVPPAPPPTYTLSTKVSSVQQPQTISLLSPIRSSLRSSCSWSSSSHWRATA